MDLSSACNEMDDQCKNITCSVIQKNITTDNIDATSRKGKFGWATIDEMHLPFIIRNEVKYLSVRMVGKKLLGRYIKSLSPHVYLHCRIQAYFITESEAKLLNEINTKHLEGALGRNRYTKSDLITQLGDTIKFYSFIKFCYMSITNVHVSLKSNYGLIQIGAKIIPYIKINDQKFVPTLFFGGVTENLESKCVVVESWDWAYLKLYCNIIGMKHTDLPLKSCPVINLIDIQPLLHDKEQNEFDAPFLVKNICSMVNEKNDVNIPWFII